MGNYKFKLSHMIPNAWFYKLKDMTKITTQHKKTIPKYFSPNSNVSQIQDQRKSYYITRDLIKIHQNPPIKTEISNTKLIDSPRKSSPRKRKSVKRRLPNRLVTSVSASCNCHTTLRSRKLDQTLENKPILLEPKPFGGMLSCECRIQNDVIHDKTFSESNNLPPIITKKNVPENISCNKKRSSTNSFSPGMKLRMNSPKIGNRRIQCGGRKSLYSGSERASLAVVKMSDDPRRDFKESMMEMIVENKITAAKELEELLVCYLLLNSDEYHVIIINVFKQIWSDFVSVHLK